MATEFVIVTDLYKFEAVFTSLPDLLIYAPTYHEAKETAASWAEMHSSEVVEVVNVF